MRMNHVKTLEGRLPVLLTRTVKLTESAVNAQLPHWNTR